MASSTSTSEKPAETKPRTLEPLSQPISVLSSDAAHLYTHVHPILLLAPFYVLFPRLVNDPVRTLSWTIVPLSIFQVAYCMTCLPPSSGTSTPQPTASRTLKRKRVQFTKTSTPSRSKAIVSQSTQSLMAKSLSLSCSNRLKCMLFNRQLPTPFS